MTTPRMLLVRQLSGLGNQMFQYAAGLYYAAQLGAEMSVVTDAPQNAMSYGDPRPFLLPHFEITMRHRAFGWIDKLTLQAQSPRLGPVIGPLIRKHLLLRALHVQIVSERVEQRFRFQTQLPVDPRAQAIYLLGYWQVHNIADSISARLRREFTFRNPPTGQNLHILRMIRSAKNTVSIHIRRGDYTNPSEGNIALPMDYYFQAIEWVNRVVRNPTFFVFSDDVEFARTNLSRLGSAVFVDHNDAFAAHEDMRLMSSCGHHIIANSTFSWWGAWLNPKIDKLVIAPRQWRVANCPEDNNVIPSDWKLLG